MSYSATAAGANCVTGGKWANKQVTGLSSNVSLCSNIKAYVPATGAVSNLNFFSIFKNSKNILPALVVGNYLGSIQAQFSRRTSSGYSKSWIEAYSPTCPAITTGGWNVAFDYLADYVNYVQTPPVEQLRSPYALPEIDASYQTQMVSDWTTCVKTVPYSTASPCV